MFYMLRSVDIVTNERDDFNNVVAKNSLSNRDELRFLLIPTL